MTFIKLRLFQPPWMHQLNWLQSGDDCAIDGKGLANTVMHHPDTQQNFGNVVSLFQVCQGLVAGQQVFENGKQSAIGVVQSLKPIKGHLIDKLSNKPEQHRLAVE